MSDPVRNPYISPGETNDSGSGLSLAEYIRPGQIITFAFVQGVLVITAVLYFLVMDAPQVPNPATPNAMPAGNGDMVLPGIGIIAAFGACVIAFLLRQMLRRLSIRKYQATQANPVNLTSQDTSLTPAMGQLMRDSQTGTLIGQAVLEGAAVLNAILMVISNNPIHLAAIAVLVVGIALQCPTKGKKLELIRAASDNR